MFEIVLQSWVERRLGSFGLSALATALWVVAPAHAGPDLTNPYVPPATMVEVSGAPEKWHLADSFPEKFDSLLDDESDGSIVHGELASLLLVHSKTKAPKKGELAVDVYGNDPQRFRTAVLNFGIHKLPSILVLDSWPPIILRAVLKFAKPDALLTLCLSINEVSRQSPLRKILAATLVTELDALYRSANSYLPITAIFAAAPFGCSAAAFVEYFSRNNPNDFTFAAGFLALGSILAIGALTSPLDHAYLHYGLEELRQEIESDPELKALKEHWDGTFRSHCSRLLAFPGLTLLRRISRGN